MLFLLLVYQLSFGLSIIQFRNVSTTYDADVTNKIQILSTEPDRFLIFGITSGNKYLDFQEIKVERNKLIDVSWKAYTVDIHTYLLYRFCLHDAKFNVNFKSSQEFMFKKPTSKISNPRLYILDVVPISPIGNLNPTEDPGKSSDKTSDKSTDIPTDKPTEKSTDKSKSNPLYSLWTILNTLISLGILLLALFL
jgi:hypothetical protein